jgi:hypothetical protein
MTNAFHNVATTGRKRGLTPVLFTQKISEVNKLVLSPGTYIMGRQTVHTDLKRYLDYIERTDIFSYMTERQIMQFISSLTPGRAIVKLANGEQQICQFYERESVHTSHTPQVQAALNRYANVSFKPATFGAYIGDEEVEEAVKPAKSAKKPATSKVPSQADQVREMLKKNPNLSVPEIMKETGYLQSTVWRARQGFLKDKKGKSSK